MALAHESQRSVAIACFCAVCAGRVRAISWESACGCVPASVGLAEDLAVDPATQFTPVLLTEAVEKRVSSLGVPVNLEGVPTFGRGELPTGACRSL